MSNMMLSGGPQIAMTRRHQGGLLHSAGLWLRFLRDEEKLHAFFDAHGAEAERGIRTQVPRENGRRVWAKIEWCADQLIGRGQLDEHSPVVSKYRRLARNEEAKLRPAIQEAVPLQIRAEEEISYPVTVGIPDRFRSSSHVDNFNPKWSRERKMIERFLLSHMGKAEYAVKQMEVWGAEHSFGWTSIGMALRREWAANELVARGRIKRGSPEVHKIMSAAKAARTKSKAERRSWEAQREEIFRGIQRKKAKKTPEELQLELAEKGAREREEAESRILHEERVWNLHHPPLGPPSWYKDPWSPDHAG